MRTRIVTLSPRAGAAAFGIAALLLLASVPRAQEPEVGAEDLPRVPATPPGKALETFQIKAGFRLDLVAAEPLVRDPVAVSFDENGRLFVIEMIGYSERRDGHLGRIRMLEDTDNDGRFDRDTIFAEDLAWPTAIICYDGGVFVGASPDILWLKDLDGDGRADERKVVFTGFGSQASRLNVQALLNNFTWGLDNRIHGATSRNGGSIHSVAHPSEPPVELRSRDFSFDPRTLTIRAEAGGGQHGMSFDDRGRKFVSSNSNHIQALMYDLRYGGRNRYYTPPRPLIDIPVDGPAAEVYRISPDEPWRITRTRWRVAGIVPGIVEGGGRVSGYFTGATGATIYRGNALPAEFVGNAFIGDAGGNLVHRKLIRTEGVEPVAERPADEQNVEFIASTDTWFRPVDFANAPDGALYILDMYREVIEHPWSIPESIKKHLDLNSGNDRGRIYRVVPEDFEQPSPIRLGDRSTAELVETLAHPNGWHRDTAARLLYERQDPEAAEISREFLASSPAPLGRMHALYALAGVGALEAADLLRALGDRDDRVRQHAVRLSERFLHDRGDEADRLTEKLLELAEDPSPFVRYQLAFSLGECDDSGRIDALGAIATRDAGDRWVEAAILTSLTDGAGELFALLANRADASASPDVRKFLEELIGLIAAKNDPDEVTNVIEHLSGIPASEAFGRVAALGDGLLRAGSSLALADPEGALGTITEEAARVAADASASEELRIEAIQLLGLTSYEEAGERLLTLLDRDDPQPVQLAALGALDRFGDAAVGEEVVARFARMTPRLRGEALSLLLNRPARSLTLLNGIETGAVHPADLSANQRRFLQSHRDPEVRAAAEKTLSGHSVIARGEAVEKFLSALELVGDPARGRTKYRTLCASCHRAGDEGYALGPDLTTLRSAGRASLLVNIVDPNREVAPTYMTWLIETKSGENHFGLIASETPQSVTVRQAFGVEKVVPRSDIARIASQGVSMMPPGLEGALDLQGMADLIEFIVSGEMENENP